MLPDAVDNLNDEQKRLYISVLTAICAADGELVREEMAALEQAMGRVLLHPEARNEIRQLLVNPPESNKIVERLDEETARLVLRDGFVIAACDGEYDESELSILADVHAKTGLDDSVIEILIEWVEDQWVAWADGRKVVSSSILGDDAVLNS